MTDRDVSRGELDAGPGGELESARADVGALPLLAPGKPAGQMRQVEPLLALVQYLPIDDALRARLARFAPVGVVDSGSFTWTGDLDAPVGYGQLLAPLVPASGPVALLPLA